MTLLTLSISHQSLYLILFDDTILQLLPRNIFFVRHSLTFYEITRTNKWTGDKSSASNEASRFLEQQKKQHEKAPCVEKQLIPRTHRHKSMGNGSAGVAHQRPFSSSPHGHARCPAVTSLACPICLSALFYLPGDRKLVQIETTKKQREDNRTCLLAPKKKRLRERDGFYF